ncbi:HAD family hydrolase [Pseudomonadota bacterium]
MTSKRSPRLLLMDLDGTLANSMTVMRDAYEQFAARFGFQPTALEFDALNGPPLSQVVEELRRSHNIEEYTSRLIDWYSQMIEQLYGDVMPNDGAIDLVDAALRHACDVGVVTSNSRSRLEKWLDRCGIRNCFRITVTGDDVGRGKPHPEPYLAALELAGVRAIDAVAVEDSAQGVLSARSAKLKTFFLNGNDDEGDLDVHVIKSLRAVRDAIFPEAQAFPDQDTPGPM